jgi:hypothetical protein
MEEKFATGVADTGGKFATSVVDTGGNFAAGVVDTGGYFNGVVYVYFLKLIKITITPTVEH